MLYAMTDPRDEERYRGITIQGTSKIEERVPLKDPNGGHCVNDGGQTPLSFGLGLIPSATNTPN